ncbi:MAG: SDR family oxidoreductase [Actinomycetota bacterium]|nr:SDR family oxidoreductase [Actinomycetota bacterium]
MGGSATLTYLITGAASGIGAATAELLAERGDRVVVADINFGAAEELASRLGPDTIALELDITSASGWEAALDETVARFESLDVLINNAGIVETGFARDVPVERHQRTISTNFMGPLTGTLAALRRFRTQGHGHIVTVCSMTAFLPFPGLASYAASKHALRAFHHAVAIEERHSAIEFTIVHPTATETPMLEQEAEDESSAFAFVAASVSAAFVAETIVTAIDDKTDEVFMPPESADDIIRLGSRPDKLLAIFDRAEQFGLDVQRQRRPS